jgi:hypothetical protein
MAGTQLQQLLLACLDLESAFNAALTTAGLDPLTDVHGDPPPVEAAEPYLVVTLGGKHTRAAAGIGGGLGGTGRSLGTPGRRAPGRSDCRLPANREWSADVRIPRVARNCRSCVARRMGAPCRLRRGRGAALSY